MNFELSIEKQGTDTFVVATKGEVKINLFKFTDNGTIFSYAEDVTNNNGVLENFLGTGKCQEVSFPILNLRVRTPKVNPGMWS